MKFFRREILEVDIIIPRRIMKDNKLTAEHRILMGVIYTMSKKSRKQWLQLCGQEMFRYCSYHYDYSIDVDKLIRDLIQLKYLITRDLDDGVWVGLSGWANFTMLQRDQEEPYTDLIFEATRVGQYHS